MDTGLLIQTLLKLYGMMLLGFVLAKGGVMDGHVNRALSTIVVAVVYPFMLIWSMLGQPGDRKSAVLLLLGGIALYSGMIVFALLISRLLKIPAERRSEFECLIVFANTGFIGAPLAQSLFGSEAFYRITLLNFAYYIFYNTYAVLALAPKDGEKHRLRARDILTPGFVMTVIAIVLYLLRADAPQGVKDFLYSIGSMTTPLSMLVLGASLAAYPFKTSIGDPWTYVCSAVKLLLLPALVYGLCCLTDFGGYYQGLVMLTCAMPSGSMVLMLAYKLRRDTAFISRGVFVSTLLSAVTIPIVILLFLR